MSHRPPSGQQPPLCFPEFVRDPRPKGFHPPTQLRFRLRDGVPDDREVEAADGPEECVDVKVAFEETSRVGNRQQPDATRVLTEGRDLLCGHSNRIQDFGEQLNRRDVGSVLPMRVEDVREAIEKGNPVGGLLRLRVEYGQAVFARHEAGQSAEIRSG